MDTNHDELESTAKITPLFECMVAHSQLVFIIMGVLFFCAAGALIWLLAK